MNIQKIKITELKPAEYNPRKDLKPEDIEYQKIKRSITEFGYVAPIIINNDMTVISGHQRLKVLEELGYNEVECVIVELNKNKEKALNIALNKISGDWDNAKLEELLAELKEIEQPISKLGDIWILGKHRLMCGDSTEKEAVLQLMKSKEADMILTDPPYNVNYEGGTKEKLTIKNDNMEDTLFYNFLINAFRNMYDSIKCGGSIYVFHSDTEGMNFRNAFKTVGFKLAECLVWVKNKFVMGRQDYQWRHEPILYGWKEGKAHYFTDSRNQTTVLEFDKPIKNEEHPTMKPIDLLAYLIKNSSKENELILDLFGGSGSTLIAAEQTNRKCYMMELDPKYCDVIIRRWEKLTGQKAELEKK